MHEKKKGLGMSEINIPLGLKKMQKSSVDQVLGAPVATEFSDYARKIRASLVFISSAALFIHINNVEIDPKGSIFGLHFLNLEWPMILSGLFTMNMYLLIHFIWISLDVYNEHRLRVSGAKELRKGVHDNGWGDYPSDPRQSTLYSYWKKQKESVADLSLTINEIPPMVQAIEDLAKEFKTGTHKSRGAELKTLGTELKQTIQNQSNVLGRIETVLSDPSTERRLEKFDKKFFFYNKSQNIRWTFIEFGLPVTAGGIAVGWSAIDVLPVWFYGVSDWLLSVLN